MSRSAALSAASAAGIDQADREAMDRGDIRAIRDRYSSRPRASLSPEQLSLLCEAVLKYNEITAAQACLDAYERRARQDGRLDGAARMLAGKRALLALALGKPDEARRLVLAAGGPGGNALANLIQSAAEKSSYGLLYVLGLADAQLLKRGGRRGGAGGDGDLGGELQTIAGRLARQFDPAPVFFAASLYAVAGEPQRALDLLNDPNRDLLLRHYGLLGGSNALGSAIAAAPFRLAIFDEFTFGWLGRNALAPAANVYVEYLAARCLFDLHRDAEARERYDAILAFPFIEAYRDVYWRALYERAQLALRAGDMAGARQFLTKSADLIEAMRNAVGDQQGRISFVDDKQDVYRALQSVLLRQADVERALEYAERSKSRALVDLLSARALGSSPEASLLVTSLDLSEAELQATPASDAETYRSRQAAVSRAQDQIRSRAPSLAPLVAVSPISAADLRAHVGADEAAVEFVESAAGMRVFTIQRDRVTEHDISAANLAGQIGGFENALNNSAPQDSIRIGQALYRALMEQALQGVTARKLIIIPTGSIYHLPFAALHDGQRYLIERFAIRIVPSLSTLALPSRPSAGAGGIVVGNPNKGEALDLPGAEAEARLIARLSPQSKLLIGPEATVEAVRSNAAGHAFFHFAGHGDFDQQNPLDSSLVFAPVAGRPQLLTAADLFTMRLDINLAVLSGCSTGVGEITTGDDVIGLVRGFLYAGPTSIVSTLWSVDDEPTAALMAAYYESYLSGMDAVDALRAAQLRLIADKTYKPISWAAFFVTSISS